MAFPTNIDTSSTATLVLKGIGGPFVSSAGSVYVILSPSTHNIGARKATDPATSFAAAGTDVDVSSVSSAVKTVAAFQLGSDIHVATTHNNTTSYILRYHVFSMASDTWTITNEAVTNYTVESNYPTSRANSTGIHVRSDGDVILHYTGAFGTSMGTNYNRVYYARREAAAWTVNVGLDAGGATDYISGDAVKGASDRTHFFWFLGASSGLRSRTLTSANALEAAEDSITFSAGAYPQRGTSYVSGANTKVRYPYINGTAFNAALADSADDPTYTTETDITGAITDAFNNQYTEAFVAQGTTLWNVHRNNTDSDIYVQNNPDGAGWSTASAVYAGTVTAGIFANVYTRGAAIVLGIVFPETNAKYTELTLSSLTVSTNGTFSATDVADKFTATGYTLVRGTFAATDAQDKFTAAAKVIVRGTFTATDRPDTFSATGTSYAAFINGTFLATDAPDKFTATAAVKVSGLLAATDAPDKFTSTAQVIVRGLLAATDAPDKFTATAGVRIRGTFVATDVPDQFTATAGVRVRGTFSATDAPDIFSATGYSKVSGLFAATDAQDKFTATAQVIISGTFTATDAPDVFSASGQLVNAYILGTFAATDSPDKFTATASVIVRGTFAATDTPDNFTATAAARISSTFIATDTADKFTATAAVRVSATFLATDRPDTFASTAQARISGTFAATDAPDRLTATAYVVVSGTFNATDTPDRFTSIAAVRISANFTATDRPDTFVSTATSLPLFISGVFIATDAPDTFTSTAQVIVSGTFLATDSPDRLSASATVITLSAAPAVIVTDGGSGGGGSKRKPPYIPASRDFWDSRERYLRSLQDELGAEPEPEFSSVEIPIAEPATPFQPALLLDYRFQRAEVISAIPQATSMRQLRPLGDRLRSINKLILEQKLLQARAELHSIQSVIDARRAKRNHRIRRARRTLAALEIARSLTHLYTRK